MSGSLLSIAVLSRMFSGAGMEAVSKRGVCFSVLLGVGLMVDSKVGWIVGSKVGWIVGSKVGWIVGSKEGVKMLVGAISAGFVLVRVTVMNLVLFLFSSMSKV